MSDRAGIFAGDNPFDIAKSWLAEAEGSEPNDPNAIALSTVDADGLPNVRMVLLKEIEDAGVRVLHKLRLIKGAGTGWGREGRFCDALEISASSDQGARYCGKGNRPTGG